MIWFLPARKSTFLAYSQQQEKLRKFLQKYGLGSSFPLDIIIMSANHIINASSLTPLHEPYSRNLPILLQFCVFWGPYSQRRCYAATLSQALVIPLNQKFPTTPFICKNLICSLKTVDFRLFLSNFLAKRDNCAQGSHAVISFIKV